jgi:holo-[acyl-carrier protein] synthase
MASPQQRLSVGIDLVQVSRVTASLARFGDRFMRRIFTDGEIAYATSSPSLVAERFAARLAAKEAAMKALDLGEQGVGWREIEVQRAPSGAPTLVLHGTAHACARKTGVNSVELSLSHEGDYATAVVITMREQIQ